MSLFALLQISCLIAFALLLGAAAWQDLRSMRIADWTSIAIAATYVGWAAGGMALGTASLATIGVAVGCAGLLFAAGVAAFAAGAFGGGDVKLLAASSLFAGPLLIPDFLLVTALSGGLLGVAVLAGAPIGPAGSATASTLRARLRGGLPYGPAIAAGGLWTAGLLLLR
jgi:prepilin peptidase CpaA